MTDTSRSRTKLAVIIVSVIVASALGVWFIHSTTGEKNINPGGPVRGLNITSASLEGYDFTFLNGNQVTMSNPNMTMNIMIHPFISKDGSDSADRVVFTELHVINDSVQKSVVLRNVYSNGSVTYIFSPQGDVVQLAYVISYVENMYILFNFSLGMASYIQSGSFSYNYNLTNPNYGNYIIAPALLQPQVSYYGDQNTFRLISFSQLPTNKIDYVEISITPSGDYLEFMTGSYNIQANNYYTYDAFSLEAE